MKKRQYPKNAFLTGLHVGKPHRGLHSVGVEVGVRQHGTLRYTGRATCVLQERDVALGIDRDGLKSAIIGSQSAEEDVAPVSGDGRELLALQQEVQSLLCER